MTCTFQAIIGGKFAPLSGLKDGDIDINTMITTYNTAVTDAACKGTPQEKEMGHRRRRLATSDETRNLKGYEVEVAKEYREVNKRIQKEVKKAKTDWICAQYKEIETCLNNTAREHTSW